MPKNRSILGRFHGNVQHVEIGVWSGIRCSDFRWTFTVPMSSYILLNDNFAGRNLNNLPVTQSAVNQFDYVNGMSEVCAFGDVWAEHFSSYIEMYYSFIYERRPAHKWIIYTRISIQCIRLGNMRTCIHLIGRVLLILFCRKLYLIQSLDFSFVFFGVDVVCVCFNGKSNSVKNYAKRKQ